MMRAGAKQSVHWFFGGHGLGIQQGIIVCVASPKSMMSGIICQIAFHMVAIRVTEPAFKTKYVGGAHV
jgi:GTP-dependent phosphoenolpyruvate carboxykinase